MITEMQNRPTLGQPVPDETLRLLADSRDRAKATIESPKNSNWTEAFFERYAGEPLRRRQALSFAYALENEPIYLFPRERLVGQVYYLVPGAGSPDLQGCGDSRWDSYAAISSVLRRQKQEIPELARFTRSFAEQTTEPSWIWDGEPIPAHIGWHWDWILAEGIQGMLERVAFAEPGVDDEGREFLEGMRIVLNAMGTWADRHVEALEVMLSGQADDREQKRLRALIGICGRVPRHGARTFHEAVQSFHFSYSATMFENPGGGNGPGRLDYYLWPFLEADLAQGRTTLHAARLLIDELFIRIHERVKHEGDGHVNTIVVGGTHPNGSSAANPLSRIMVESIAGLGISHPSVYIRMPDDMPTDLMHFAARDICEGGNRAQIIYDKTIVEALTRAGIAEEHARMYMCGGCMEISPQAMNGDMLFCGFFNVAKVLELVLSGGECLLTGERMLPHLDKDLTGFDHFEDLYTAFVAELRRTLELTFRQLDIGSEEFAKWRPHFLTSSQVEDCILRGRGINNGGALYEDFGSTPLAIPNAADSLSAIREAVFEQRFIAATDFLSTLKRDFHGREPLRRRLVGLPKFGEGNEEADGMAQRVTRSVCGIYEGWTNRLGGRMKPMIMSFMMAAPIGAALGASADGRRARAPIAQGVTPQSVGMRDGITTAIRSACSLPLEMFSGGTTHIWDLSPDLATPENVRALLEAYFRLGGQMYHGDITDIPTLRRAQASPSEFPQLMVRVGGYSARFVALDRAIQDEIISRRRHTA